MVVQSMVLVVSCVLLFVGAELFVAGAVAVGQRLGWSPTLIGVVLVGWATAFPEILVSAVSAWHGQRDVSLGNALGSYITNMSLVLGVSACLKPIVVCRRMIKREGPIVLVSLAVAYFLMQDGFLSVADGVVLLLWLLISTALLYYYERFPASDQAKDPHIPSKGPCLKEGHVHALPFKVWGSLLVGLIMVWLASEWMVHAVVALAHVVHLTPLWMGLVVVAVGTSLPELAASVMGALKGHSDIAVGNVIGSNIFGLLAVLAMPALMAPGPIESVILRRDFTAMISVTLLFAACLYQRCRAQKRSPVLKRWHGVVLLLAFFAYFLLVYWTEHV